MKLGKRKTEETQQLKINRNESISLVFTVMTAVFQAESYKGDLTM